MRKNMFQSADLVRFIRYLVARIISEDTARRLQDETFGKYLLHDIS